MIHTRHLKPKALPAWKLRSKQELALLEEKYYMILDRFDPLWQRLCEIYPNRNLWIASYLVQFLELVEQWVTVDKNTSSIILTLVFPECMFRNVLAHVSIFCHLQLHFKDQEKNDDISEKKQETVNCLIEHQGYMSFYYQRLYGVLLEHDCANLILEYVLGLPSSKKDYPPMASREQMTKSKKISSGNSLHWRCLCHNLLEQDNC
jgi:hypothetical protein